MGNVEWEEEGRIFEASSKRGVLAKTPVRVSNCEEAKFWGIR